MGDLPPAPMATAGSSEELPLQDSKRSDTQPAVLEKTVTSPHAAPAEHVQPQLGRGSAIFSTDLGRRAPRKLEGPPYPPVIVHSNMVPDVVSAASLWRSKYPYQYLCIFPHSSWDIHDLWDDEDIHLETEPFCRQVLQFIERDNAVRAQKYAQDWSDTYPERLPIVGGDMTELYDKSNPLSIVDKIFVSEESRMYPHVFLWHVAHIMRTAMLTVKGIHLPINVAGLSAGLDNDNKKCVKGNVPALATAELTATVPAATVIAAKASTHGHDPAAPMSSLQPLTQKKSRKATPTQGYTVDPNIDRSHSWTPSHGPQIPHGQYAYGSGPTQTALRVPRTRVGRSASGTYSQPMAYVENMPRVPSGLGPGVAPVMQSPRYNQAPVSSQPMGNYHPSMVPLSNEQAPMPFAMMSGSPQPHAVRLPNVMPPHAARVSSGPHNYSRQPLGSQYVPFGAPMGDVTNSSYPPGMSPQPGDRRLQQQYVAGNVLYDPYDGNNPAFMSSGYFNGNNRKAYSNGHHNFNSRPRKTSFPGNRPYQGQYTSDRYTLPHMSGKRNFSQKNYVEIDSAITQDRTHGCYETWIGPQNETVNELFVKDLPEDIEASELEVMFHDRLGVKPTSINIKNSPQLPQKKHAFVGFGDPSIAKQGISIRDATIRQKPISITVPRRFFQRTVEVPSRDIFEPGPSPYSRYTGNPNNGDSRSRGPPLDTGHGATAASTAVNNSTSYSPQDARSDLNHKKKSKQSQHDLGVGASPKAQKSKSKKRQESPAKASDAGFVETLLTDRAHQADKAGRNVSSSSEPAPHSAQVREMQEEKSLSDGAMTSNSVKVALPSKMKGKKSLDALSFGIAEQNSVNNLSDASPSQQNDTSAMPLDWQKGQSAITLTTEEPEQDRSLETLTKHSSAEQGPAPIVPVLTKYDASSMKRENLTSHSASESLKEEKKTWISSDIKNQGTVSTVTEIAAATEEGLSDTKITVSIAESEVVDPTMSATVAPTAEAAETHTSEVKTNNMAPPVSQGAETSPSTQQDTTYIQIRPPNHESIKKSGAQYTESLHPFSKATKAQAKKEKEQKKKALRREKEQAEKAKAAKAASGKADAQPAPESVITTKVNDGPKIAISEEDVGEKRDFTGDRNCPASYEEAAMAETSNHNLSLAGVSSNGVADNYNKPGNKKGKTSNTLVTHDTSTAEKESQEHGKHIGGTVSIPNESSSVTNKEVKTILQEDAPASDAQSSDPVPIDEASSAAKEPARTVKFAEEPSPAAKKKKNNNTGKKKKKAPAWPDLEFRRKSPNPSWMGPIDMATDAQHYDEIVNRACCGEDDSDFSWSDIPLVEDEMSHGEEVLEEGDRDNDEKDLRAIQQRIAELSDQQAATSSNVAKNEVATLMASGHSVSVQEPEFAAKNEDINMSRVEISASEVQRAASADTDLKASAVVEGAPTSKKKKRKNKKKKATGNLEMREVQASSDAGAYESNAMVQDPIDSDDPFYDQLKEIEDTRRISQTVPVLREGYAETAKPCDESQLMRTMEAYFKETQGSGQSKSRKVSKHDLYN